MVAAEKQNYVKKMRRKEYKADVKEKRNKRKEKEKDQNETEQE